MQSLNGISNNKIKEIVKLHQKKYRDETGLFIAEGYKSLEGIIEAGVDISAVYAIENAKLPKGAKNVTVIPENIMKKISTTDSVCEILTVASKREISAEDFSKMKRIALLDSVSDPGNLGTIIRSAAAFGIDGILLYGNCTDAYSPKVIRSSAGNFFKVPIKKWNRETEHACKEHFFIGTAPGKEFTVSSGSVGAVSEKLVIMFGSEAAGLCDDLMKKADKLISLEMKPGVESLNLAVSASIIFYELFKS